MSGQLPIVVMAFVDDRWRRADEPLTTVAQQRIDNRIAAIEAARGAALVRSQSYVVGVGGDTLRKWEP